MKPFGDWQRPAQKQVGSTTAVCGRRRSKSPMLNAHAPTTAVDRGCVEPAAVADVLNRALEEREAARADLDRVLTTNVLTEKKIADIVDGLGVAELLNSADPS